MPLRSVVGRLALTQETGVRIPQRQPITEATMRTNLRTHGEDGGVLIYISKNWQVIRHDRRGLDAWWVRGISWGVRVGRIGIVRL